MNNNYQKNGLTTKEVSDRTKKGQVNVAPKPLTFSIKQILFENIFTYFNFLNVLVSVLIIWTGHYKNLLFLAVVIANTAIGIFQEIRSKREIDKMSLLAESQPTVIRDGQKQQIRQVSIVLDDLLVLSSGDQIPVDGTVISSIGLSVDESQLTGESLSITKNVDERVTSGSFVIGGTATVHVTEVGNDTTVSKLTAQASKPKETTSVLIQLINKIITTISWVILPLGALLIYTQYRSSGNLNQSLLAGAAAMVGMIPEGLVLLTSVTMAVSAYNLARKKVLVKTLPAIETLARVDILCTDKTGTITSGNLIFDKFIPNEEIPDELIYRYLSTEIYNSGDDNSTNSALKKYFPNHNTFNVKQAVPFNSKDKQSSVTLDDGTQIILGAPEFLDVTFPEDLQEAIKTNAAKGSRVLGLVRVKPDGKRTPIAIILLRDELRKNSVETFKYLQSQGVDVKILSGDNPVTVSAISKLAGIENSDKYIDISTINDETDYHKLVNEYTIFGRINPLQKQQLIETLRDNGHTPAMVGDGVNDVLAIKHSACGIAMGQGSDAAKSVADFVLIDSDFDKIPPILNEGRRVINNVQRVASLYLIKTIYSIIFSFSFIFISAPYPFMPIQLTPVSSLSVGIPSFFLSLLPDFHKIKNTFLLNVRNISLPAGLSIVTYIFIFMGINEVIPNRLTQMQLSTLNAFMAGVICFIAINRISQNADSRFASIFITLLILFGSCFVLFRSFFNYASLLSVDMLAILLPAIALSPLIISVWRHLINYLWSEFIKIKSRI